eukprot:gene19973-30728_t
MCEATAKILVLTYMPANCTCAASTDLSGYGTNAFNPVEYQMMRNLVHDTTINDSTYDDSMLDPKPEVPLQTIMLVNGQYQPQMPMVKNVWYRFDIIMAAGDTVVDRWTMSVKVGDGGSIFEPLKAPADIGGDEDDFR